MAVIKQTDPRLVAIKAELLHGVPELTGTQINKAAFFAVIALDRLNETSKCEPLVPWQSIIGHE
jgi:hypothetical protein